MNGRDDHPDPREEDIWPDPREEDIWAGDRRISRPDCSLPDWEVPDCNYRPVPIVWFTGALILQTLVMFAVFMLLIAFHGAITVGLCAFVSGAILSWTWSRGMKDAGGVWKAATVVMLALNLLLVCLGSAGRF